MNDLTSDPSELGTFEVFLGAVNVEVEATNTSGNATVSSVTLPFSPSPSRRCIVHMRYVVMDLAVLCVCRAVTVF